MSNFITFTPGDRVEIIKTCSTNLTTSFYPATIILVEANQQHNKPKKKKKKKKKRNKKYDDFDDDEVGEEEEDVFMVQYQTQLNDIVSYVERGDIRPVPPPERGGRFRVGDEVDVLREGCWMKGRILGVLYEGVTYLVEIQGQFDIPVEVPGSCLRVHRDWCIGSWVPPLDQDQKDSLKMEQEAKSKPETVAAVRTDASGKRVKFIFKRANRQLAAKFSPGATVEVRSDEDGYQGSWYAAVIVGSAGDGKFLVEYQTLKTDDEMEFLKEVANEQDIRPCPPEIPHSNRYKEFEEIDTWYNDGWWEGVIHEVLNDWRYIVYFALSNERLVYQHPNLRPRQNWVDGKWVLTIPKCKKGKKLDAEEPLQVTFREGMLVEVRSYEDGYPVSWYAATVIGLLAQDKFLVEYDSLKTNDENQPLRDKVSATDVRPLPPCNLHIGRYKCLEEVDAWLAGGWWVGSISEVLKRKKYTVHFTSYGVKQEIDHVNLRPHLDWIDGNWINYKHKSSDVKLRKSSSERKYRRREANKSFGKGTMVEIKSDEPGYEGSWYSAIVVRSTRKGRFLVEYRTLKSEDGKKSLREEVEVQNIRPCPPKIEVDGCYFLLEKVDSWYNDGWWAGGISKLLADEKYMVYFEAFKEELEFDHINLRTRQEWINGNWITANKDIGFLNEKLI